MGLGTTAVFAVPLVYNTKRSGTFTFEALRLTRDNRPRRARAAESASGLIERFSEDLDLKIEPGSVAALPIVSSANLRVLYPGLFLGELPSAISGNVRLEVGSSRVTPHVARDLTSWIHEKLVATNVLAEFGDNRATGVRCVHPLVTLLEKLDALHRGFPNEKVAPAAFVRHYENMSPAAQRIMTLHL